MGDSKNYTTFRSSVSQKKVIIEHENDPWIAYDVGPKSVTCPLICLPPVSGRADCFFLMMLRLLNKGYRVISLEYPVFWTVEEFCDSFEKLLDEFKFDQVHILGASLGGFLAQKFAERCCANQRVCSLILCNAFSDTAAFGQTFSSKFLRVQPAFWMKRKIWLSFPQGQMEGRIADSIDFIVEKLDEVDRSHLASRLALNFSGEYTDAAKLSDIPVTIIDVNDDCVLTEKVKSDMYKCYPHAKRAHLKDGGNFPYLSRVGDVVLYVEIHLRNFFVTRFCPVDSSKLDPEELRLMRGELPKPEE